MERLLHRGDYRTDGVPILVAVAVAGPRASAHNPELLHLLGSLLSRSLQGPCMDPSWLQAVLECATRAPHVIASILTSGALAALLGDTRARGAGGADWQGVVDAAHGALVALLRAAAEPIYGPATSQQEAAAHAAGRNCAPALIGWALFSPPCNARRRSSLKPSPAPFQPPPAWQQPCRRTGRSRTQSPSGSRRRSWSWRRPLPPAPPAPTWRALTWQRLVRAASCAAGVGWCATAPAPAAWPTGVRGTALLVAAREAQAAAEGPAQALAQGLAEGQ
ncbi:hypothetical protein ABPG75_007235 [Micractinium tetrahymenae]